MLTALKKQMDGIDQDISNKILLPAFMDQPSQGLTQITKFDNYKLLENTDLSDKLQIIEKQLSLLAFSSLHNTSPRDDR